jgi:hypothetical protein
MPRSAAFVAATPLPLRADSFAAARPRPTQRSARTVAAPAARSPRAALAPLAGALPAAVPLQLAEISSVNYNSLAVTALVFVLTFWGGISFVKGSIKPRITQASFSLPVPAPDVAKTVSQYLMTRGFKPDNNKDPRPGVVVFEGNVRASSSVAAILVAVGASGLWAGSLILNVLLPDELKSDYWGLIALASLAVVPWYKGQAARVEEVKVMVEASEAGDGGSAEAKSVLFLKAHRDEILTLEEALGWRRNDPDGEEAAAVVAAAAARAGES